MAWLAVDKNGLNRLWVGNNKEITMDVEQQISRINTMREQLELLEAEFNWLCEKCKQQPDFKYPIYMQWLQDKAVVKFIAKNTGVVVVAGSSGSEMTSLGFSFDKWIPHTDENFWQPIVYDEERGIADKQLCECSESDTHIRIVGFYDAKNKCLFSFNGRRNGFSYDNYCPIPYVKYPDWAKEAQSTLED
jgi:hypothetical protein